MCLCVCLFMCLCVDSVWMLSAAGRKVTSPGPPDGLCLMETFSNTFAIKMIRWNYLEILYLYGPCTMSYRRLFLVPFILCH